ncbi:MAG: dihydroxyacetone kinase subunit DhaL [Bacillota bacterium]
MKVTRDGILNWLKACAEALSRDRDYLTQLDAAIGDADHGANMDRGFQAVLSRLPGVADKDIGTILKTAGMALVSTVGGAAGPLYGTFFMQAGVSTAGKMELSPEELVAAVEAGVNGVIARGKATLGDKTMVDALVPALEVLRSAVCDGTPLRDALRQAAAAAAKGAQDTIPMVARKGRASYLGDRSAGHQDPGATSSSLLLTAAAETLMG